MFRKTAAFLLAAILCTLCVSAACSISVPVSVAPCKGGCSHPARTLVLRSADSAAPMPSEAENGECAVTVRCGESTCFPEIVFTKAGIYGYTVLDPSPDEERSYDLTVTVSRQEDGSLAAAAALRQSGGTGKLSDAQFGDPGPDEPPVLPTPEPAPLPEPEPITPTEPSPGSAAGTDSAPMAVPQTGLLIWPIPLLFLSGCVLTTAGIRKSRK